MKGTTAEDRFVQVITVMVGKAPPPTLVASWLAFEDDGLQGWVIDNMQSPLAEWAQGIVVLEAATLLANSPQEGGGPDGQPIHTGEL